MQKYQRWFDTVEDACLALDRLIDPKGRNVFNCLFEGCRTLPDIASLLCRTVPNPVDGEAQPTRSINLNGDYSLTLQDTRHVGPPARLWLAMLPDRCAVTLHIDGAEFPLERMKTLGW